MSIEEFDSDTAIAVDVVNPGTVHFGVQLLTERRHQLYLRTNRDINVHEERRASVADFDGLGLCCKRFARRICSLHIQSELDWNSRASRSLSLTHYKITTLYLALMRRAQSVYINPRHPWLNTCRHISERQRSEDQTAHDHAVHYEHAGGMRL